MCPAAATVGGLRNRQATNIRSAGELVAAESRTRWSIGRGTRRGGLSGVHRRRSDEGESPPVGSRPTAVLPAVMSSMVGTSAHPPSWITRKAGLAIVDAAVRGPGRGPRAHRLAKERARSPPQLTHRAAGGLLAEVDTVPAAVPRAEPAATLAPRQPSSVSRHVHADRWHHSPLRLPQHVTLSSVERRDLSLRRKKPSHSPAPPGQQRSERSSTRIGAYLASVIVEGGLPCGRHLA